MSRSKSRSTELLLFNLFSLHVLAKFPVVKKLFMYLFWIYIVLKVPTISSDRANLLVINSLFSIVRIS